MPPDLRKRPVCGTVSGCGHRMPRPRFVSWAWAIDTDPRTYSGRRPGGAGHRGRTDETVKFTDGTGGSGYAGRRLSTDGHGWGQAEAFVPLAVRGLTGLVLAGNPASDEV
jgi:hypothetical protein